MLDNLQHHLPRKTELNITQVGKGTSFRGAKKYGRREGLISSTINIFCGIYFLQNLNSMCFFKSAWRILMPVCVLLRGRWAFVSLHFPAFIVFSLSSTASHPITIREITLMWCLSIFFSSHFPETWNYSETQQYIHKCTHCLQLSHSLNIYPDVCDL